MILTSKTALRESVIICDRITMTKGGIFRAYISVQLSKADVKEAMKTALLEENEAKINFNEQQFDKTIKEVLR